MTRPFRFALQMRDLDDRDAVVAGAIEAEELGYVQVFSYDHLGSVDPFAPLLVAAGATSRIGVGPLVLNNEFHHPVLLARTASTVDAMTGGRLVLGLGTGYARSEHDAMGLALNAPGPRVRCLAESVEVIRSLLDTDAARFDGEFHHVDVESLGVRPSQRHVPLLIGGHGRRLLRLAGRTADIVQFSGLTHGEDGAPTPGGFSITDVRTCVSWLTEAAGDRNDHIERSALVQVVRVGDGAEDELATLIERFGATGELLDETPFVLLGSVEQIVDKLERLRADVGLSHYVVRDAQNFSPIVAALTGR